MPKRDMCDKNYLGQHAHNLSLHIHLENAVQTKLKYFRMFFFKIQKELPR